MNWVNYEDVLSQLRTSGLLIDSIDAADIGVRRRCRVEGDKEKRGWFHLHEIRTGAGDSLLVGTYGAWRGNDPGSLKIALQKGQSLTPEQAQALKDRIRDDQKREQARRRAEGERAARRAGATWLKLTEAGTCDYLDAKRIQPYGVRFSERGAMAIPLQDVHGVVHGLQLIYPKGHEKAKRLGRNKDFWPTGLVKQGHFFMIGAATAARVILLAEGYATAATLHEATGLPVAVAFDAGNLLHVAQALAARYREARLLICADDDYLAKCRHCSGLTLAADPVCAHCGADHLGQNAGVKGADAVVLAVPRAAVLVPFFPAERPTDSKGATDFNDLHVAEGLRAVAAQVEAFLSANGWAAGAAPRAPHVGEGDSGSADLVAVTSVSQFHERFCLVYEMTETVFDAQEHKLVPLSSMRNLGSDRNLHRAWMDSMDKRIARLTEVGFDPTERDRTVKCNLWGGWPTVPKAGDCSKLWDLGEYLCSGDARGPEVWQWVLKWLAYPVQHPGAKMQTALVMHGPQGTGKNLFFEVHMRIFGEYGRIVGQQALEDKFNDTFSRKLFLLADEVVDRKEMFHVKNLLKGLVTGTEIRINPKNVGAYFEKNHLNLAFLSNEPNPLALEEDDRRYCVVYTPGKLEADVYHAIQREIEAGGVEAWHDYLLHLDLGDFGPATKPPMTQAKKDLIELGLDSSVRFFNQWLAREFPLPVGPVRAEDWYEAYRHVCSLDGIAKPAQKSTLLGVIGKRPGVRKDRPRHYINHSRTAITQSTVLWPPGAERDLSMEGLSNALAGFADSLARWKDPRKKSGEAAPDDDDRAF